MAKVRFLRELRRRHVFRVAAAYAVVGWLLIQVATQVFPFFELPNWSVRLIVLTILAGFPIALVLAWAFDATPRGVVRTANAKGVSAQRSRRAGIAVGLAGVLIAVFAGYGYWHWQPVASQSSTASISAKAAAPSAAPEKSIAVLPFANLSRDPDNAFFADGMQDEILTKLSKIAALRVVSRISTRRYASVPDNLAEIASQLGVANLLEGSVQRAGNTVHINVQLIRAASDEHLWAESYNRTLDDIFGMEGEVAQAVAEALDAKLSGAEQKSIAARPTDNPAAYEAYLRGRAIRNSGYGFTAETNAVDASLEAVRLDPKFALAWAHAAIDMSDLYFNGVEAERFTAAAVRQAAETALRLQPDLGEALLAHGFMRYRVERDYPAAMEDFKLALKKLPNDSQVLEALFFVERRLNRWDDALAHMELATRLDPRNVDILGALGCEGLFYVRRFDEARDVLKRALQVEPDQRDTLGCLALIEQYQGRLDAADVWLARTPTDANDFYLPLAHAEQFIYRRQFAEAIRWLQRVIPASDAALSGTDLWNLIFLGYAQKWSGDPDAAHVTFQRALGAIKSRPDGVEHISSAGAAVLALACEGVGDHAAALDAAKQAVEQWKGDVLEEPTAQIALAQIYAQHGDRDAAIAMLPQLLETVNGITPALLMLDPMWDPIRDDPRFLALANGPASAPVSAVK